MEAGDESLGWITPNRHYKVLGIYGRPSSISYRIIGDDGITPALHSAKLFQIVSPKIPEGWIIKLYAASEWELTPEALAGDEFWDRYFSGETSAEEQLRNVVIGL